MRLKTSHTSSLFCVTVVQHGFFYGVFMVDLCGTFVKLLQTRFKTRFLGLKMVVGWLFSSPYFLYI